jgi:DNA (cytosine-5)-methyltransferase 1
MQKNKAIPVISLFSGAMGLDIGLEQAGFKIVLAVECDAQAVATIKLNQPDLPVIHRRIEEITTTEILKITGLKRGGEFIVSGGPSCQSFSTAGQRKSLGDPRGGLFRQFLRVVKETQPKFFIMENVKGMLSAAVIHRPLKDRGPGHPKLKEEEELGSAFKVITQELRHLNYYTAFDVLNSANFGTPQCRERIIFIGSRNGKIILMPSPTHAKEPNGKLQPWVTLRRVIGRFKDSNPRGIKLRKNDERYLRLIPEGGNWRDLPPKIQEQAMGGALKSWGGRSGFFRRLSWDRPSPALTTQPNSKATLLCHPSELRPLSLREYARIQQFPDYWKFSGSIISQYRQIGNAVPVGLGAALGRAVMLAWNKHNGKKPLGVVETLNQELIRKMSDRPITILNPPEMCTSKSKKCNREWSRAKSKKRTGVTQYLASQNRAT